MESAKRKIIIIGSAYPLRGGGISTFNERLAQAFQEQGDDVIIYTFSLQYPSFLFPGTTQYSKEAPPDKLNIKIQINSINPINWIISAIRISKEKPDLVVIRYWIPFMAPCLGTIARLIRRKVPVVAITDNVIPHEKRIGDRLLTRYFVKSVDRFVAMSKTVLNDLAFFDQKKTKNYHPHPLYDNFGNSVTKQEACRLLNLESNQRYILFFGFIREYKGLDLLLKAMSNIIVRKMNVKLIVAGEFYSNEEYYLNLIKSYQISDSILLYTTFIPNTDVYKYFCAADIVAQPYKNATQSGVTQIAYHFSKAMITTNVGGLSEMVPNGKVGFVVNPDPEEIASAIENFYSQNLEAEFVQNIIEEKKRFTWEGLIKVIENKDNTFTPLFSSK